MRDNSNAPGVLSPLDRPNREYRTSEHATSLAERIAFNATHPDDWPFIHQILRLYPAELAQGLARRYAALTGSKGRSYANTELRTWKETAQSAKIALTADLQAIEALARNKAKNAAHALPFGGDTTEGQYRALAHFVRSCGLEPPEADPETSNGTRTQEGCVRRMLDTTWWRRALRKQLHRERERIAITLGLVNKRKSLYCSRAALEDNQAQQKRNAKILESLEAVDETGEVRISMADIAAKNVSNPEIRYAELMTRLRGFEELVNAADQETIFVTVTCPSRMHAVHSKSGRPNEKYDGTTPYQAHQYLQETWQRCRAKLSRKKIPLEGYRIAEPHHDGCPHWHLALATTPECKEDLVETIEDYFTREDPDEDGIENRVKVEYVRSIAGYLSKYVSKNIDGAHVDKDFYGKDAKTSAHHVRAWASLWGIRQFQPIGGASVTVYRELRRVRDTADVPETMRQIHAAADAGDWAEYERLQGGLNTSKKRHVIQLTRAWNGSENRYGEESGYITIGVEAANDYLNTRPKTWTIERCRSLQPIDITQSIADALGFQSHQLDAYQAYCTWDDEPQKSGVAANSEAFEPGQLPTVQLFTQGQGAGLAATVAPTGAEQRQPNAPPAPDLPPLDAYTDQEPAATGYPEGSGYPDDWDSYATYAEVAPLGRASGMA